MPLPLAAFAVAKYLDQRKAAQQQRREAAANILAKNARDLGAPTYNVDAARAQNASDVANRNALADLGMGLAGMPTTSGGNASRLVGFMDNLQSEGDDEQASAFAQDYENNPPMRRPYGGGASYK